MTDRFTFLLAGHDTVECAYYLVPGSDCEINFALLAFEKESLRQSKSRDPKVIKLGNVEFLLYPYGSKSGYSFIIENTDHVISFSEFMSPSFFVKFKCRALWQKGAVTLHEQFMTWAKSIGLSAHREESLSRVDFSFDYHIPEIDFDENSFVSLAKKDSRYRKDRIDQTFQFGKGNVVLRVYDKVAEIEEESHKNWFYELWQTKQNVWRIEWQCRKPLLKRFGLYTFADLMAGQGDILRYLATEHDTLRVPNADKNRSRWPLHPLWQDLQTQIESMDCCGVYREINQEALLEERIMRIAVSALGNLKRVAAIDCVKRNQSMTSCDEAIERLTEKVKRVYDPFSWKIDVEKRINQIRLGQ